MATTAANSHDSRKQTQLNVAIDSDLHQQLRLQAVIEKQSLREYSERLLREALVNELSRKGQSIAPSHRKPVKQAG